MIAVTGSPIAVAEDRTRRVIGLLAPVAGATMFVASVVFAFLPEAISPEAAGTGVVVSAGLFVPLAVTWLVLRLRVRAAARRASAVEDDRLNRLAEEFERLKLFRGVEAIASDRQRTDQFSRTYESAAAHVYSWGVGMTNASKDAELLEKTVAGGRTVHLELIDPQYLRANPEVARAVDAFYARPGFTAQIEDSLARIVTLAERLNRKYGERVRVTVVQIWVQASGTIADPCTPDAWGYIEHHTPRFPHGQVRLKARAYEPDTELDPPLIQHVLMGRADLPRRQVYPVPTAPEFELR